eukprot:CAMPEP_0172628580 /NCGR_PEP_ID=MMETSP1068-20121228/162746_1 /TAXON_ID=35684 /ORGANISM="Pseudopedinella elastica, Strain CCMP716" /LENGTH=130 /DNA_ID=CAMNT_0013438841 /DNA_START=260 /DNA_END=652 /DNA_ORIENTATION=-
MPALDNSSFPEASPETISRASTPESTQGTNSAPIASSPTGIAELSTQESTQATQPLRIPMASKSALNTDVEWLVTERNLYDKEWIMWSLLSRGGVRVSNPGQEEVALPRKDLQKQTAEDDDDSAIFELDL